MNSVQFMKYLFIIPTGIMFESTQAYIPNIKPHSSYKVSEYISDSYQVAGFEWNNYYTEVIY